MHCFGGNRDWQVAEDDFCGVFHWAIGKTTEMKLIGREFGFTCKSFLFALCLVVYKGTERMVVDFKPNVQEGFNSGGFCKSQKKEKVHKNSLEMAYYARTHASRDKNCKTSDTKTCALVLVCSKMKLGL
jgi:hypothetical protein